MTANRVQILPDTNFLIHLRSASKGGQKLKRLRELRWVEREVTRMRSTEMRPLPEPVEESILRLVSREIRTAKFAQYGAQLVQFLFLSNPEAVEVLIPVCVQVEFDDAEQIAELLPGCTLLERDPEVDTALVAELALVRATDKYKRLDPSDLLIASAAKQLGVGVLVSNDGGFHNPEVADVLRRHGFLGRLWDHASPDLGDEIEALEPVLAAGGGAVPGLLGLDQVLDFTSDREIGRVYHFYSEDSALTSGVLKYEHPTPDDSTEFKPIFPGDEVFVIGGVSGLRCRVLGLEFNYERMTQGLTLDAWRQKRDWADTRCAQARDGIKSHKANHAESVVQELSKFAMAEAYECLLAALDAVDRRAGAKDAQASARLLVLSLMAEKFLEGALEGGKKRVFQELRRRAPKRLHPVLDVYTDIEDWRNLHDWADIPFEDQPNSTPHRHLVVSMEVQLEDSRAFPLLSQIKRSHAVYQ